MKTIDRQLFEMGIVPVVILNDPEKAVPLAKAMEAGGIPTAEITFRTQAAEASIRNIAREMPHLLVGAGTITSIAMAERAVAAGAKYLVSPGFNPKVVSWCVERNIPIFPGVTSPSEIEAAMELGLTTLKFFPAEAAGGLTMLKSFASPYGGIRFMPTGGISDKNINDYLKLPNVVACGGSWICPTDLIAQNRFQEITALCKKAVAKIHGFHLAHVGINCDCEEEATATVNLLSALLGLETHDLGAAYFSGTMFEVMKSPFLGKHGHIALGVHDLDRGIAHFERMGIQFRMDTYKAGGIVYLQQEIGGFALHLKEVK